MVARPFAMTLRLTIVAIATALIIACGSDDPNSGSVDSGPGQDLDGDGWEIGVPDASFDVESDSVDCRTLGCACEADSDCEAGYCLDHPDGGRVCSEFCDDACSVERYECVLIENSGGDAVRICIPERQSFCDRCNVTSDCGSLEAACVPLVDGDWCIVPCGPEQSCPDNAVCEPTVVEGEEAEYCVPLHGVCEGCVDRDGDRFGLGPDCLGEDPDDEDPLTHPGAPETCDGRDNDGDGDADEGFDLTTDPQNCGACGVVCAVEGGTGVCDDGLCRVGDCPEGFADCDLEFDNGCETDLSAPELCGTCGVAAEVPGSPCGTCGTGIWACDADLGDVTCEEGAGDEALNGCGGCGLLEAEPGDPCGTCSAGRYECDGDDAVSCVRDPGDTAPASCAVAQPLRIGWSVGDATTESAAIRWSPAPVMAPYRRTTDMRMSPVEVEE